MSKKIVFSLLLAITVSGCVTTAKNTIDSTTETTTTRPLCKYDGYSTSINTRNFITISRFYKELASEKEIGQDIKEGSVLYYGKFAPVKKIAIANSNIANKDSSPLNRNWAWNKGDARQVVSMLSIDNKNWWYLIDNIVMPGKYWTSDLNGMLCNNVLGIDSMGMDAGALTTRGLPNVYQDAAINIIDENLVSAAVMSVSVSVKKVAGASATVIVNLTSNGIAFSSREEQVDLIGGEFFVQGIKFKTKRSNASTTLISVTTPENLSAWMSSISK